MYRKLAIALFILAVCGTGSQQINAAADDYTRPEQNMASQWVKSRPEFIRQIRRELLAGGQPVFDPYALPRQGPGRPRKQEKEEGLRPLLLELCRRLAQLTEATEQKDLC